MVYLNDILIEREKNYIQIFKLLNKAIIVLSIPITFNNPLKVFFSNKKYTPDTNCKIIFLIEKPGFKRSLKIIDYKFNYPSFFV